MVTEAQRRKFEKHISLMEHRAVVRFLYAKAAVPPNATGVSLEGRVWSEIDKKYYPRWFFVTPALPQDAPAKWRISHGDERGPIGHEISNYHNEPFMTKYEAIYDIMVVYRTRHPRVTGYVLPGQGLVTFKGFSKNPIHAIWRFIGKSGRRRVCQ